MARRKEEAPSSRKPTDVLDRLSSDELAAVLIGILRNHPELEDEASAIALNVLLFSSSEDVAEQVIDAVSLPDIDDLNDRAAGSRSGDFLGPGEAAEQLLEEAVEPFFADMKRKAELGLCDAAEVVCLGIVTGLYEAKDEESDGASVVALGWAPDFSSEQACSAVVELLQALPDEKRVAARDRIVNALAVSASAWRDAISRAADRTLQNR
jgi:hypothetical protein